MHRHPIRKMIEKRKKGIFCALPSYCSANELVIEAIMEEAGRNDDFVLIEATANQVNQYGGYTGMQAADFVAYINEIADRVGFDKERLMLGGDHLGPLTWNGESEETAMEKADCLVRSFVKAGFTKIHLDTSMRLGSDDAGSWPDTDKIAERGVRLYQACEETYREKLKTNPQAMEPIYVIGSEVPIPGGGQDEEGEIKVTSPADFEETIQAYTKAFERHGIRDAWDHIAAVVVQPGVEFSDSGVCKYDRVKAHELCRAVKRYPDLVMEGHSTDYQGAKLLREMAEDGVGILKVGPALTFSLREALFSLHKIEKEVLPSGKKDSDFINVLEKTMLDKSDNWKKHYHGSEQELFLARKYSFSDRCRYYLGEAPVKEAISLLFRNLDETGIPLNMLCQYLPIQYKRVRDGIVRNEARALAKDAVVNIMYDYEYATKENWQIEYR